MNVLRPFKSKLARILLVAYRIASETCTHSKSLNFASNNQFDFLSFAMSFLNVVKKIAHLRIL